jgi:hypothetical protein
MWKPVTAAVISLLCAVPAVADPLYAKNLAPVAGLFGFPVMRHARTLDAGQFTAAIHGNIANSYTVDRTIDESVNFDVETRRLAFRAAYGLGAGWEVEAEVPWLRHEGGDLDKLIEKWHSFWNLPDGNRDDAPRNLVNVRYAGPGASFALADEVDGWGDIQLAVVKTFWATDSAAVSARAGVKLGTGDEQELIGSGSEDYYVSLNFSGDHRGRAPIVWHGQLGYLRAGDAEVLGSIQEQDLWFAGLGMEWRTWKKLHLKLQVDSHSAVADSSLTQLGDVSVQITAGLSWLFAEGLEGEFSFSEDIAVDTAPDFVLQLGIRYRGLAK